jgi:hypothetical protein
VGAAKIRPRFFTFVGYWRGRDYPGTVVCADEQRD